MARERTIRTGDGPAVNRHDGRRIVGPLDPRAVGKAAHEVIQLALVDGVRSCDYVTLSDIVGRHPFVQLAPSYRQAARARLTYALSAYMRFFVPPEDWQLVGCEHSLGDVLADVVWRNAEGRIVLDELKVQRCKGLRPMTARIQVETLRQAGRNLFGDELAGIRLTVLGAPRLSRWIGADGHDRPLALR